MWFFWFENIKEELGKVYILYNKVKDFKSLKENEWVGLVKKFFDFNFVYLCWIGFLNRFLNILVKYFVVDKI